MSAAIPERFRGRARRDAAAFYLSQLAKGVLAGQLDVLAAERRVDLATAEFVTLELRVEQKKRATHIAVKLKWPRQSPAVAGRAGAAVEPGAAVSSSPRTS